VGSLAFYLVLAVLGFPLWWPALRAVLSEVRLAADSTPPASPPAATVTPLTPRWSTTRTRLAALQVARQHSSSGRWEGGFGRRSP